jgi:hypothetical protein
MVKTIETKKIEPKLKIFGALTTETKEPKLKISGALSGVGAEIFVE